MNMDILERGFRYLADRQRLLHEQAIRTQIDLATVPWLEARQTLHAYPDVVALLDALYPEVVPYLIKGHEVSPVHHIAYVVSFMAKIAVGENLAPTDVKRVVLAALLHDIGIGDSLRPKISERQIGMERDPVRQQHLRREGIASRCEHMEHGVRIGRELLQALASPLLSAEDHAVILEIVGTHDNSKIPLMEQTVDPVWLLRPGADDWLKQCHWEADALWMLCPAGLLVDLQRGQRPATAENVQEQFAFNLNLHRAIVTKYEQAFTADGTFAQYGFRAGTLYRTATGFHLAQQFARQHGIVLP